MVGAGPAGLAAALALAALGAEVVIAAPAHDPARAEADRRTTALLLGSVELLKNLGVWRGCAGESAPVQGVRIVDDRGGLLRAPEVLFKARGAGSRKLRRQHRQFCPQRRAFCRHEQRVPPALAADLGGCQGHANRSVRAPRARRGRYTERRPRRRRRRAQLHGPRGGRNCHAHMDLRPSRHCRQLRPHAPACRHHHRAASARRAAHDRAAAGRRFQPRMGGSSRQRPPALPASTSRCSSRSLARACAGCWARSATLDRAPPILSPVSPLCAWGKIE